MNLGFFKRRGVPLSELNTRPPFKGHRKGRSLHRRSVPGTLKASHKTELKRILGYRKKAKPTCYACNLAFIERLSRGIQATMVREWGANGERDLKFVSVTPEHWVISELSPALDLRRWRSDASRWLKLLSLNGVGIIEGVPFLNYPWPGTGRAIAFHLHCFGYADDDHQYRRGIRRLKQKLNPEKRLRMTAVVAKTIRPTEGDVGYTTGYCAKTTASAKRVSSRLSKTGKNIVRNAPLPLHLALRMSEIMSYIRPQELIVTRGRAAWEWRRSIFEQVGDVAIQRRSERLSDDELGKLWLHVWEARCEETTSGRRRALFKSYEQPIVRR